MSKVYAIGESLLDVIVKNGKELEQKAGGSILNASISLGRLKQNVFLISELGLDNDGNEIDSFLRTNNVNVLYVKRFEYGSTAKAVAMLDENNNASYTFYKDYPTDRLDIIDPVFSNDDILLFGSIYAIEDAIRPKLIPLLDQARKAQTLVFYDPNIRKANLGESSKLKVLRNFQYASIIRCSNEDMRNVFGNDDFDSAKNSIPNLESKIFIYTCAENGVYIKTPLFESFYKTPQIEVVSSIGAGDTFNAGIIYGLVKAKVNKSNLLSLKKVKWDVIIQLAIEFASEVCQSYDNYISNEYAKEILDA